MATPEWRIPFEPLLNNSSERFTLEERDVDKALKARIVETELIPAHDLASFSAKIYKWTFNPLLKVAFKKQEIISPAIQV